MLNKLILWTLELVKKIEASEYTIVQSVDHWLDWIIGGFITKFVIDTTMRYSEAE